MEDGEPKRPAVSLRGRAITGTLWTGMRFGARQGANTLAFFAMAALMTPEAFGLGAIAVAAGYLLRPLVYRGFRDAVIQAGAADDRFDSTAWWQNAALGALLAAGLALAAWPIGALAGRSELIALLALAAAIPFFTGLSAVQEGRLERAFSQKQLAAAQTIASLGAAGVGVAGAWLGWGAWAFVIARVAEVGGVALATALIARWLPHAVFDRAVAKDQRRFAAPVIANGVFAMGLQHATVIIVGAVAGAGAAGLFRIGLQVRTLLMQTVLAPASQVLLPVFAKLGEARGEKVALAVTVIGVVVFPVFLGAGVFAPPLIVAVLSDEWAASSEAVRWLAVSGVSAVVTGVLTPMLIAHGEGRVALIGSIIGFIAGVALTTGGAILGGATGAAIGLALRFLVVAPVFVLLTGMAKLERSTRLTRAITVALAPGLLVFVGALAGLYAMTEAGLSAIPALASLALVSAVVYPVLAGAALRAFEPDVLVWIRRAGADLGLIRKR